MADWPTHCGETGETVAMESTEALAALAGILLPLPLAQGGPRRRGDDPVTWLAPIPLLLVLAFTLAASPPPASAQIFRWVNGEGDIHFSQGVQSVPLRYLPNAVIIGYDRPSPPEPTGGSTPLGTGRVTFTPGKPILVTARINERDSAQLMLDTGAVRTVINPSVLSALGVSYDAAVRGSIKGVTGDAEVLVVRVDSIDVSGAKVGPLAVVSHDPGFGPGRGGGLRTPWRA